MTNTFSDYREAVIVMTLVTDLSCPSSLYKSCISYFKALSRIYSDYTTHCPATSIVKIFMSIEVIHLILTARKNGFGKVVSDNLLMEGKFSYFNFNVLQCKKLAFFFCKF